MNKGKAKVAALAAMTFAGCVSMASASESVAVKSFNLGAQSFSFPGGKSMTIQRRGTVAYVPGQKSQRLTVFVPLRTSVTCDGKPPAGSEDLDYPHCLASGAYKRDDIGMKYLARKLARKGNFVLVLDAATVHQMSFPLDQQDKIDPTDGLTRLDSIAVDFQAAIKQAGNGVGPLAQQIKDVGVDTDGMTLMGHSHGGELALQLSARRPRSGEQRIREVVAIEPSIWKLSTVLDAQAGKPYKVPDDLPLSVLVGSCDEDTKDSALVVENLISSENRTAPALFTLVDGLTHIGLNSVQGQPQTASGCTQKTISTKTQRAWLNRWAPPTIAALRGNREQLAKVTKGVKKGGQTMLFGRQAIVSWRRSKSLPLQNFAFDTRVQPTAASGPDAPLVKPIRPFAKVSRGTKFSSCAKAACGKKINGDVVNSGSAQTFLFQSQGPGSVSWKVDRAFNAKKFCVRAGTLSQNLAISALKVQFESAQGKQVGRRFKSNRKEFSAVMNYQFGYNEVTLPTYCVAVPEWWHGTGRSVSLKSQQTIGKDTALVFKDPRLMS